MGSQRVGHDWATFTHHPQKELTPELPSIWVHVPGWWAGRSSREPHRAESEGNYRGRGSGQLLAKSCAMLSSSSEQGRQVKVWPGWPRTEADTGAPQTLTQAEELPELWADSAPTSEAPGPGKKQCLGAFNNLGRDPYWGPHGEPNGIKYMPRMYYSVKRERRWDKLPRKRSFFLKFKPFSATMKWGISLIPVILSLPSNSRPLSVVISSLISLIRYGYHGHNKHHRETCSLTVLEAKISRSRCRLHWFLKRSLLLADRWLSSPCILTWSSCSACLDLDLPLKKKKVFIDYVTVLFLFYILVLWPWGKGSYLPDQRPNLHPLHWKVTF